MVLEGRQDVDADEEQERQREIEMHRPERIAQRLE